MRPVPTSRIKVGERLDPARATLAIAELAASIQAHGQLQPIVVTPDFELLAGRRRLAACEQLGIDVHVRILATAAEELEALDVEWAENAEREEPTPEARYRYAQRRLVLETAAAGQRRAEGARVRDEAKGETSGTAGPEVTKSDEGGRAATRAAKAAGLSGRKELERIGRVVEAVAANPELAPLLVELNTTGKAAAVAAKLERVEEGHDPDSWCTPSWVLEAVHAVETDGISLDPCTNANAIRLGLVRAGVSWTIDDNALEQTTWDVEPGWTTVWYQPPYSDPGPLTRRLCEEWDKGAGGIQRVHALVKLDTSTSWWASLRERAAFVILPRKRIAHVVGDKPRKGSDFCSGMMVLARGDSDAKLVLFAKLREAYEGKADVYPTEWIDGAVSL